MISVASSERLGRPIAARALSEMDTVEPGQVWPPPFSRVVSIE
jgi:hypothetical protein